MTTCPYKPRCRTRLHGMECPINFEDCDTYQEKLKIDRNIGEVEVYDARLRQVQAMLNVRIAEERVKPYLEQKSLTPFQAGAN